MRTSLGLPSGFKRIKCMTANTEEPLHSWAGRLVVGLIERDRELTDWVANACKTGWRRRISVVAKIGRLHGKPQMVFLKNLKLVQFRLRFQTVATHDCFPAVSAVSHKFTAHLTLRRRCPCKT